jgi:hypothetical protein
MVAEYSNHDAAGSLELLFTVKGLAVTRSNVVKRHTDMMSSTFIGVVSMSLIFCNARAKIFQWRQATSFLFL